jgi:hypothetical protein
MKDGKVVDGTAFYDSISFKRSLEPSATRLVARPTRSLGEPGGHFRAQRREQGRKLAVELESHLCDRRVDEAREGRARLVDGEVLWPSPTT